MAPPIERQLSTQQLEYLFLTALGWDTQRIARKYHVTKSSVNAQLYRVYRKLDAVDAANAVLIACHEELIGPNAFDASFITRYKQTRQSPGALARVPQRRLGGA